MNEFLKKLAEYNVSANFDISHDGYVYVTFGKRDFKYRQLVTHKNDINDMRMSVDTTLICALNDFYMHYRRRESIVTWGGNV